MHIVVVCVESRTGIPIREGKGKSLEGRGSIIRETEGDGVGSIGIISARSSDCDKLAESSSLCLLSPDTTNKTWAKLFTVREEMGEVFGFPQCIVKKKLT